MVGAGRHLERWMALGACAMVLIACGTVATSSSGDSQSEGAAPNASDSGGGASPAPTPHPFAGEDAWIAYQTDRGGGEGVWLIHPDGTENHEIALDVPGQHLHPDWSPDGTSVLFTSREAKDTLYVLDMATEEAQVLLECADPCVGDDEAVWSPNGSRIAFVRGMEPFVNNVPSCALAIGDPASDEVELVTETTSCLDRPTFPHWSRDGARISYYRGVYADDGSATSTALYVLDVASGEEAKLTDDGLFAGDSDWSAGDEWIVFATYPLNDFQCCEASDLYRIHPDGSGLEQLTQYESVDLRATQPRFTPDGEWIIFTSVGPAGRLPWIIPADGGEPIAVASGGIFTHATWQPGE